MLGGLNGVQKTPGMEDGMKRKILVILSDRFRKNKRPLYIEISCEKDGTILSEKRLKAKPAKPVYDEVWQNNEGRDSIDACNRMKRDYRHPLQKPRK
jgi:hypothetical protein